MELKIFENEQFGQVRIAMDENGEPIFLFGRPLSGIRSYSK